MEKRASRRRVVIFTGALFLWEPRAAPPSPLEGVALIFREESREEATRASWSRASSVFRNCSIFFFFFFLFVIKRKRNYFGISFDSRHVVKVILNNIFRIPEIAVSAIR